MASRICRFTATLFVVAVALSAPLRATNYSSPFTAGQTLSGNDCLYSGNEDYRLCIHSSGSYLDLYNIPYFNVYWDSSVDGYYSGLGSHVSQTSFPNDGNAHLQLDGNFIIFSVQHNALWTTQTDDNEDAYIMIENDGNMVIYDSGDVAIWSVF